LDMLERMIRALDRRWQRYHQWPEIFYLNIHHWLKLERDLEKRNIYVHQRAFSSKDIQFMGTRVRLVNNGRIL
jgi:hypothetical protein